MSPPTTKTKRPAPHAPAQPQTSSSKAATASRLRSQTRKQLGKHYRAKFGVR